ncbi:MAG: tetratricopeptide repeat protein [Euzebyales bacterium]|nr:tetratricopeptide repeat protein [Euzebyales bacterium]
MLASERLLTGPGPPARGSAAVPRGEGALHAAILMDLGTTYCYLGDHAAALQHHLDALRLRERLGDDEGRANVLNNIGIVFYARGELDEAARHGQRPEDIAQVWHDPPRASRGARSPWRVGACRKLPTRRSATTRRSSGRSPTCCAATTSSPSTGG